jgi:glutamine---fructose-6-phosphate transaminase (isomerizing)
MDSNLSEILEIPERAKTLLDDPAKYSLPLHVPYLAMGSSYFATLAFKYMGFEIYPEIASEFHSYLKRENKIPEAVILSQSGRSSEPVWCTSLVDAYTAITNDLNSPLALAKNAKQVISIMAGEEHNSSSKTYTNTLLTLFKGFGIDANPALNVLINNMSAYQERGKAMAKEVFDILKPGVIHGVYIVGNGPNIATAMEAALILSESTKRNFHGLPMAQYDHGPKETAKNSVIIQIVSRGPSYVRTIKLAEILKKAGAHVIQVEEKNISENLSVVNNIVPFNFMAYYLAHMLNVGSTFTVGGKVTEVEV